MEVLIVSRRSTIKTIKIICLGLIPLLIIALSGCAGKYRQVSEENRIVLSEGAVMRGIFDKGREAVQYEYILNGNSLKLNGRAYARGHVATLDVRVLFVGEDGYRIDEANVYYSGYRLYSPYPVHNAFQKEFTLPEGTSSITFDFYVEYRTSPDN